MKFEFNIVSYFDREDLIAEVYCNGTQWAEISIESAKFIVELYSHPTNEAWKFSYDEAMQILETAKQKLQEKTEKQRSLFPPAPSTPEGANRLGDQILEEIVSHPEARSYANRFGGMDVFEPSGRGARFDQAQQFLGFLQLRQHEKR